MNITTDNLVGMLSRQTNLTTDESEMAINALSEIMGELLTNGCSITFGQLGEMKKLTFVGFPPK